MNSFLGRPLFGFAGAALGGYTNTPEWKVLAGAFADAYNRLVARTSTAEKTVLATKDWKEGVFVSRNICKNCLQKRRRLFRNLQRQKDFFLIILNND
jgi:hypothetical protein